MRTNVVTQRYAKLRLLLENSDHCSDINHYKNPFVSHKSIPRVMLCGYVPDFVLEIKNIILTCIHICRLVLGEQFYEYCVIMVKKIIPSNIHNRTMLILKTIAVCTVNLKHDKRDTLKTTFCKHFLNYNNT